jgi:hypothetical protein
MSLMCRAQIFSAGAMPRFHVESPDQTLAERSSREARDPYVLPLGLEPRA